MLSHGCGSLVRDTSVWESFVLTLFPWRSYSSLFTRSLVSSAPEQQVVSPVPKSDIDRGLLFMDTNRIFHRYPRTVYEDGSSRAKKAP